MKRCILAAVITMVALGCSQSDPSYDTDMPYGNSVDVEFSRSLWDSMVDSHLAGRYAISSMPYVGEPPHGVVLDTIALRLEMNGNQGAIIIKRNYAGSALSPQMVADNPERYLEAITVMYQRPGYDPDNYDWFWAMYKPDGSLFVGQDGRKIAGRVGKDANYGCIACHKSARGGDLVFSHDRFLGPWLEEEPSKQSEEYFHEYHNNIGLPSF